jgi:type IV pilus assembly protein PilP
MEKKKPAIKPKSEISEIKQAAIAPLPLTGDKLIADTKKIDKTTGADGVPFYDPTGKIDPFEPLFKEKSVTVAKKKRKRRIPRTPLERIDLSQLKLVGIIMASSGNRALVEEANGKGYVIKKGTFIGTSSGKVVKIKKEKVIVEEEFEDAFGKIEIRKREIKLPKPSGEL